MIGGNYQTKLVHDAGMRLTTMVRRFSRSDSGGALLELAVIAPLLLLLLVGAVDYGRAFYTSVTVANAARAGAEYGAQNVAMSVDTAGMKSFAQGDGQDAGNLTVSAGHFCQCAGVAHACTMCGGGVAPEVYVWVTATKPLRTLLKYPGLRDTITVVRKATFRSQ